MQLTFKRSKIIGRQLHIELAETVTGNPFPIRMNADGSYMHKHRGNQAFVTALDTFEKLTIVDGKPIRELWLTTLNAHLASAVD